MERRLTAKLSLRDVVVRRDGRVTLDVPSLDVAEGETLAVIGPNGAGKTTLLLQMALLERPGAGSVLFDGEDAQPHVLAYRRRMAVVFQQPLLLDRSVRANVETGMRMRGVAARERRERCDRWLGRFGIAELAGRSSRALSGGEAQRASLARAFALEPQVLLLDEPFSALDQPTRLALLDDLAGVLAETRVTAVLVTHDHDEAARIADRVAVLIGGRMRQIGAPSEIFGAPADADVAAFVGIETMFEAPVVGRGEGIVLLAAGAHQIEAIGQGVFGRALVCLRPEDITISRGAEAPASARNRLPATVRRITASGATARVELDAGFGLVARITRRSLEELELGVGEQVVASFKATAVHLIPRAG
ncbi:MAG TPA: ABC transporter ATP-binding protein [Dehalococcoidia bacterium]|nr:ABC transporter ATP-binding protein [Dehalococcoidia bacterium]